MLSEIGLFIFFNIILACCITLDLLLHKRKLEKKSEKTSYYFTLGWVLVALFFNLLILILKGKTSALEFLSGYLIELSLSIDNLFVFIFVFDYFQIKQQHQHIVLFWGIIGALVMRLLFIIAGVALISKFHWIIYLFGAFLVFAGVSMFNKKPSQDESKYNIRKNPVLTFLQKFIPFTEEQENNKFFVRKNKILMATPLFVALVFIEITDLLFAIDSIPAVFGITLDPFIVYTSNACAIGGLRSLYTVVQHSLKLFRFLHKGVSSLLIFIGIKMLISPFFYISTITSLIVIALIIGASILLSILIKPKPSL